MKKKYESPRAVADLFYPEESISSCYNIACEYGIMGGEKGIHAPNAFTLDGVTIPGDLGADDTHGKLSAGFRMRLGRKSDCRSRFQWKSNSFKRSKCNEP